MKLVKVHPFGGFEHMVRRMNHIMNDLDAGGTQLDRATFFQNPSLTPRVDIVEDAASYTISVELPGLAKEDVKVAMNDNRVLTISGEKKQEEKTEGKNFHRVERRYGSFSRSFNLPKTVHVEAINARFENGVLVLSLPKVEEPKPQVKEITVQ